jgi:hypothetical protein
MNKKPVKYLNPIAVKILLTVVFISLAAVILVTFIAELQFNAAQRLAQRYLWQDARQKFKIAMRIDPFNATLPAGFAYFLKDISLNRADENALLIHSGRLYKRALELDPFNAEYALRFGETQLALFRLSKAKDNNALKKALDYFKLALENDPQGFDLSYAVGYAGISVWDKLDAPEKKLVLDRLKYTLKIKPWYSEYIYPHLLQSTKDSGLLRKIRPTESDQERREKLSRIERIKQGNLGQSWQGKPKGGNDIYENGNMYWTGTMDAVINVPAGRGTMVVKAKGSPADDIWPYMIVELDGEEIGETFVDNSEWKEYNFPIETSVGLKVLSVTFSNDGGNAQKDEDRNLYVGEVRVEG